MIRTKYIQQSALILIILIASLLRLWQLGSIPPHLSPDEAALGYNAYSIIHTLRDEHGKFLPIIFKSFGDYKPGLYVYLSIPSIVLLGLTEFAVRLPSAVAGIIAVWLVYKIVLELKLGKGIATASSFILALSPWSIQFSRGAWEANVSLTLTMAGIWFFLKSLKQQKFLYVSAVFFALTLLTYQGAKLSTAIVLLILCCLYIKDILKFNKKALFISLIAGLLISMPIMLSFFKGETGRLGVFSVFSYPRGEQFLNDFINETDTKKDSLTYYLFYNEALNFLRGVLGRYFNHFSGRFLFFEGDWQNPMFSPPYQGVLTLADLGLFITGGYVLLKKVLNKAYLFVLLWLLLSPLPAVLSRDQVQAVRALNMVIPLAILLGIGLELIWNKLGFYKPLRYLLIGIYFLSYLYYLDAYFVHFPKSRSNLWGYGYKEIVQTINSNLTGYDRVKVQQSFSQPYIYFLFYGKYDPAIFQQENNYIDGPPGDVGFVTRLGKIQFGSLDYGEDFSTRGIVAAKSSDVPPERIADKDKYKILTEISNPGDADGFVVFTVNPYEE